MLIDRRPITCWGAGDGSRWSRVPRRGTRAARQGSTRCGDSFCELDFGIGDGAIPVANSLLTEASLPPLYLLSSRKDRRKGENLTGLPDNDGRHAMNGIVVRSSGAIWHQTPDSTFTTGGEVREGRGRDRLGFQGRLRPEALRLAPPCAANPGHARRDPHWVYLRCAQWHAERLVRGIRSLCHSGSDLVAHSHYGR
jgi:hypothetical protein